MSRYARRIRIAARAADVWAAVVDVETWPAWASQFKRLERLDAGVLAPGSRVRVTPRGMPAAIRRITDYEEGHHFTWSSSLVPGVLVSGGHVVTADGDSTHAEFWLEGSGPLGTVLAPLLQRTVFSRNTRSATEGLKSYMERGRSPTVS
ncbi:MAG TPA: SRPBCC family protein [Candidatus Limnocylindrales bacterium]|nr:SRPBCC family protein [Candidatus Limnocylindrales bacterium]